MTKVLEEWEGKIICLASFPFQSWKGIMDLLKREFCSSGVSDGLDYKIQCGSYAKGLAMHIVEKHEVVTGGYNCYVIIVGRAINLSIGMKFILFYCHLHGKFAQVTWLWICFNWAFL